jgi:histidine triad (HIT) family protein
MEQAQQGCIFCKIASGTTESDIVASDDTTVAFTDLHPKAPVHVLVIPKMHIESVMRLDEHQRSVVDDLVYMAKSVAAKNNLSGYKLVFNVGRAGGQVIDHLHLHLLGGWSPLGEQAQAEEKSDIE